MHSYTTVKEYAEYRFEDRKSVFLGFVSPVTTEAEALLFVADIKKRYPDARHWVYAYVLRENSLMRYTDDKEPQGTAGMPVLDVIRKNGCTDTVIVVVRYFGGTLLGTGGLVHAYTEAAKGALTGGKIIKYDLYTDLSVKVSYSDYGKISTAAEKFDFLAEDTIFTDEVEIVGNILSSQISDFSETLNELTAGRCKTVFSEEKFNYREKN